MKVKNMGLPLTEAIRVRLNEDQLNFLKEIGELLGVTPSEYLRMSINAQMIAYSKESKERVQEQLHEDF